MRRSLFFGVQVIVAASVLYFAWRTLSEQWTAARLAGLSWHVSWRWLALSALLVLSAYALLIEAWRNVVREWQESDNRHFAFATAARIWFVSNLGRYVPGKVWQIGAMGVMAHRAGVSPLVATGSSILVNLVALTAGAGVVAVTGSSLFSETPIVWVGLVFAVMAIVVAPRLTRPLARLASIVLRRDIAPPNLPERATWFAALASAVAWVLYGMAFWALARGAGLQAGSNVVPYIAAFTASYLLGYVTVFAPGGIVVREAALVALANQLRLMSGGEALLLAVASRLWLTILEIVPGTVLLAVAGLSAEKQRNITNDDAS